jgi:hypothetical protein
MGKAQFFTATRSIRIALVAVQGNRHGLPTMTPPVLTQSLFQLSLCSLYLIWPNHVITSHLITGGFLKYQYPLLFVDTKHSIKVQSEGNVGLIVNRLII